MSESPSLTPTPTPTLSELMTKREAIYQRQRELNQELNQLETNLKQVKKEILKTCDHVWEREDVYCGPYDKPDNICRRCNSIQYRF